MFDKILISNINCVKTRVIFTLCLLGNLYAFYCLLIFFMINSFKKFFQKYHQSVKQVEFRSGKKNGRSDLRQKLFAKVSSLHQQAKSYVLVQ